MQVVVGIGLRKANYVLPVFSIRPFLCNRSFIVVSRSGQKLIEMMNLLKIRPGKAALYNGRLVIIKRVELITTIAWCEGWCNKETTTTNRD